MTELLTQQQTPQMLHAAFVHLPIALAILGVPMVLFCAFSIQKGPTIRCLTLLMYVVMALMAYGAAYTGKGALGELASDTPSDVYEVVQRHAEMGEKIWIFAAVVAVSLAVTLVKSMTARVWFTVIALLLSLGTATWVVLAGHYGGTAVYRYGIGMPGDNTQEVLEGEAGPATEGREENEAEPTAYLLESMVPSMGNSTLASGVLYSMARLEDDTDLGRTWVRRLSSGDLPV